MSQPGQAKKLPRPSFSGTKTVTIRVGKGGDSSAFCVHRAFLCYHSEFFRAAFEGTLLEGTTQSMDLDSASIAAFSVLVDFVYTQTLKNEANGKFLPELEILVETAILADYVMMPKLYDSTIQGIKQLILQRKQPESGVILKCNLDWNWFMDNTKTGTPIRHLMIDFWAFDVTPKILRQQSKNLPHAMLAEISVATRTFLEDEKFLKTLRRAALANEATYVQKPDDPPLDFRWWKRKKSSGSPAEVQR